MMPRVSMPKLFFESSEKRIWGEPWRYAAGSFVKMPSRLIEFIPYQSFF